ncbi:MAG: hypothetical protein OEZ40_00725, partial [Candidatus Bathyarchaeota archaeon]|nr:hypothetical protein [Candidatus Bathyarchaeota archaeon]
LAILPHQFPQATILHIDYRVFTVSPSAPLSIIVLLKCMGQYAWRCFEFLRFPAVLPSVLSKRP